MFVVFWKMPQNVCRVKMCVSVLLCVFSYQCCIVLVSAYRQSHDDGRKNTKSLPGNDPPQKNTFKSLPSHTSRFADTAVNVRKSVL